MRFGHYWPKDPAAEKIEHLRPASSWPGPELTFSSMPVLSFEPFEVDPPAEVTAFHARQSRDDRASVARKVLFGR
jgi:hypothetical protein